MHQPSYKHPAKEHYYVLPWVRLHGVKDYYGMAKLVEKFDNVKVAFNFSGVLLEQIFDYVKNRAQDYYGTLSLQNPEHLNSREKGFIVDRFFSINFERFIRPQKRYLQLYNKKLSRKPNFTSQDIRDLQALFNLCWFHPYTIKKDNNLRQIISKEKNYTKDDLNYIIDKQYQILDLIIPLYKKLLSQGKIELTITPHHHPIMPLIYDTDVLSHTPYLKKPHSRFSAPADCNWHLRKALDTCKQVLDYTPKGSWPSEGSVSEEVLSVYAQEGFQWVGTDETILFKSLMTENVSYDLIKNQRHILYQPYKFRGVNIFFRDRNLSDTLSFVYQGWEDPVFAANDLLEHLKRTHYFSKELLKERAITIIMDGENAWEYYNNNGVEFLETIYSALERSHILTTSTPSQFLNHTHSRPLERLASGSWINGDFSVWAGSKENNNYWELLRKIKDLIDKDARKKNKKENFQKALDNFYLIEGSDWFWWNTFEDVSGEFKKLFFSYAEQIYRALGKKAPASLKKYG